MNKAKTIALTTAINAIRNDWTREGTIAHLNKLAATWTGTDEELFTHAIAIAANPAAQTPGALSSSRPPTKPQPTPTATTKEPRCFICGNTQSACEKLNDFEKRHGIPDPHDFESAEDAENNSSRATRTRKLEAIAALARSKSIPPQLAKLLIILTFACYTSAPLRKTK